jgi:methyl coenzyme M reductase gamma subunit
MSSFAKELSSARGACVAGHSAKVNNNGELLNGHDRTRYFTMVNKCCVYKCYTPSGHTFPDHPVVRKRWIKREGQKEKDDVCASASQQSRPI